jgi:hypothetical protein
MHYVRIAAAAAAAWGCAGCAHIPEVTVGYYLPRTKVSVKVNRTVACDSTNLPLVTNAVTPSVTHAANPDKYVPVPLAALRGPFTDSDIKFDFYDDGRLQGVNATSTGQAEGILKTATSIMSTLAAKADRRIAASPADCTFINTAGGGKGVSVVYEGEVDLKRGGAQEIAPDSASIAYHAKLQAILGRTCAYVVGHESPGAPFQHPLKDGEVPLKVQQPGLAEIEVRAGKACDTDLLWGGKVLAAQFGTIYSIPIPRAPWFGKQVFVAGFKESGAVGSVQYVSTTGAGQVLNVVNSALTEAQGATARKAAELKAEADLIVAQQRLARCQADPKNCQ